MLYFSIYLIFNKNTIFEPLNGLKLLRVFKQLFVNNVFTKMDESLRHYKFPSIKPFTLL